MTMLILLAQIYHPWCWQPTDGYGQIDCGYNSQYECAASNTGRQGSCIPNPRREGGG